MHEIQDPLAELGAHRRALLAQLVRNGLPGTDRRAGGHGRPVRRLHQAAPPVDAQADAELRSRLQERLGRLVSHPGAIDVSVNEGTVRLGGRVLAKEREGLLEQVQQMPGVQKLVNAMASLDDPLDMGRGNVPRPAPGEPEPAAGTAQPVT